MSLLVQLAAEKPEDPLVPPVPELVIGLIAFGVLCVGIFLMYFVVGFDNPDQVYLEICRWGLIVASLLLAALLGFEIFTGHAGAASPLDASSER